jgi:hypothetical protein
MMKRILLIGFLCFHFNLLQAQVQQVPIKQGLTLEYTIFPVGQVFPCTFILDTSASGTLTIDWKNEAGRGGKYFMTRASLDSGTLAFWGPPTYDQEITLDPEQTLLILSRKQWQELQKNGRVNFDGLIYNRREATGDNQLLIDGKPADAIFMQSETGDTRIWVLNNATLPLLLKVDKNRFGVDLQIERVKL